MREKQILPVVVVGLTAMLVAVVALWTLDRVEGAGTAAVSESGPVEVIEWKLVTTWPKGLPGLGAAPENFARRVNEASGGRLRIKVFGAGEIVPAFEVFDAVSRGVAEAGHGASYYWKGKIPASVFYTAVPFGMAAQEARERADARRPLQFPQDRGEAEAGDMGRAVGAVDMAACKPGLGRGLEMRQKGDEVAGMVLDPGGPRHGFRKPMAALVMADHAEAAGKRLHDAVPDAEIGAQRIGKDDRRTCRGSILAVMELYISEVCNFHQ